MSLPEPWDTMFLRMSEQVSHKSKDPKTKVGAVLVSPDRRDIAIGYNGFPSCVPDIPAVLSKEQDLDGLDKHDLTVHAEMNAILNCGQRPEGWTLYVTHTPCIDCAKHILGAGIAAVVTLGLMTTSGRGQDKGEHLLSRYIAFKKVALPA